MACAIIVCVREWEEGGGREHWKKIIQNIKLALDLFNNNRGRRSIAFKSAFLTDFTKWIYNKSGLFQHDRAMLL